MLRSLRRHGSTVAVVLFTAAVVAGPPVSAHITQNAGHNWNTHYRPLADARYWKLSGNAITATQFLGTTNNRALNVRVNNARAFRLEPNAISPNVIGGFPGNSVSSGAFGATIGGGGEPGFANTVTELLGTVGGGEANTASGISATVAGGALNEASEDYATVAGGLENTAGGGSFFYSAVGGGRNNTASGQDSTVGGGVLNVASGGASSIPGGSNNLASADFSFAAGRKAKADDVGAYVWGDSQDADVFSPGINTFSVRALGGIWLGTGAAPASMTTGRFIDTSTGGYLSSVGVWTDASSRTVKENFAPVDPADILDRVTALPVTVWNYRGQDPSVRHIGPVAEDFHSVFGVGDDSQHIASLDTGGVALAAIQGLNQRVEELSVGTETSATPWMPWAAALVGFALCLGLISRRGLQLIGGGPPSS